MTRGRIPKPEEERAGHRDAVGQGEQIEVAPVEARLVSASPPDDMSPLAQEVWRICVSDMGTLGHLRAPDLMQIRNYAVEVAIAIECEKSIAEFGAVMKEPITAWSKEAGAFELVGFKLKKNPASQLHREAANAARLIASELVLTPIARIRGNLLSAVTASVAMSIKDDLEKDIIEAEAVKAPRKKPAARKGSKK